MKLGDILDFRVIDKMKPKDEYCDNNSIPSNDAYDRLLDLCDRMCDIMESMSEMNRASIQANNTYREPTQRVHHHDDYYQYRDSEYDKAVEKAWRNFYRSNGV